MRANGQADGRCAIPGFLTEFGHAGELFVVHELRRRGFSVDLISGNSDYDILIEGRVRAEVKSAFCSRGSRGRGVRWQFSLRRHGLDVDEDILFLTCWEDVLTDPLVTFVVPGSALAGSLAKIDITSDPLAYRGKWMRYREDWSQVQRAVATCPAGGQLLLFRDRVEEIIPF